MPLRRFMLFLCRTVFHCSLEELRDRLSPSELMEWQAEYALEPWGEFRSDLQAGQIAATIGNANGGKKSGGRFGPGDFLLKFNAEPRRKMTWQETSARFRALTLACGGLVQKADGTVIADGRRRGK